MLVRRHKGKKKTTLEDVMPKPVFQPEQEEKVEDTKPVNNNEQEASEKKSKSKKGRK